MAWRWSYDFILSKSLTYMHPLLSGIFLFVYMKPKLVATYQPGQRYLFDAMSISSIEVLLHP